MEAGGPHPLGDVDEPPGVPRRSVEPGPTNRSPSRYGNRSWAVTKGGSEAVDGAANADAASPPSASSRPKWRRWYSVISAVAVPSTSAR